MNRLARLLAFGAGLGVLAVAPALAGETTAPSGKNVPPSLMLQNEREAVPAQDYPSSSYRSGEEGTSSFKVWADANGKLLDCQITKSSGVKALDDQTCASLRLRGKFTASGAPNETDDRYSMTDSVQWVIPASVPRPLFLGVTLTDSQPTKESSGPHHCALQDHASGAGSGMPDHSIEPVLSP